MDNADNVGTDAEQLTIEGLATEAHVSSKTLRRLIAKGHLVPDAKERIGGRRFRYMFNRNQVAHVAHLVHDGASPLSPAQSRPRKPTRQEELDTTRKELDRALSALSKAEEEARSWREQAQQTMARLAEVQAQNGELIRLALPQPAAPVDTSPAPRRPWWAPWRR
ncbi:MAG TPA: hypothetical protein PLD23_07930 [Armatimonadota bacterium]|nr:hypothetical protein [Armatimonadota bacterium]HQK93420.1 hypothetical protein [Armatimonadota bacterium]